MLFCYEQSAAHNVPVCEMFDFSSEAGLTIAWPGS